MSESAGFAIPMPERSSLANGRPKTVDLNAVHYFWFGRRLWLLGLGKCVQAFLLMAAGVFLLTQISSTPNLVVQIAITGGLMTIGGLAIAYRALGDFLAGLRFDHKSVRVRTGWMGVSFPWSQVERWRVADHMPRISQLPVITFWLAGRSEPLTIAASNLDDQSRDDIHELFRALAYGKEAE